MIPDWLRTLRTRLDDELPLWFAEHPVPAKPQRESAVLVLFGHDAADNPTLVLTERAHHLRSHAAQVVFPGGHVDPGETPEQTALRESNEEIGLDATSVEIVDALPGVYMTPQDTAYVPVLGWWHTPHPVDVVDPDEVRRIVIPTLDELTDPANRFTATAPGGYAGPAFEVHDLIVWGITAKLLEALLDLSGFSRPWDASVRRALPWRLIAPYASEAHRLPTPEESPGG
ncbi:CoA pyrophosphatase [Ammonicoccus fulvus]|uniref:CoA pyrophosphatase n=1 Tax=Ammonicoccus fulvus TaxID=3138240 RepID=A0ABZ3FR54_9ACTN